MTLIEAAVATGGVATGVAGAAYLGRVVWRGWRRLGHIVDDIVGEPAHGDQPERPGLMGQLRHINGRLDGLDDRVARIEDHLGTTEHTGGRR